MVQEGQLLNLSLGPGLPFYLHVKALLPNKAAVVLQEMTSIEILVLTSLQSFLSNSYSTFQYFLNKYPLPYFYYWGHIQHSISHNPCYTF